VARAGIDRKAAAAEHGPGAKVLLRPHRKQSGQASRAPAVAGRRKRHAGEEGDLEACVLVVIEAVFGGKLQIAGAPAPACRTVCVGKGQADRDLEVWGRAIIELRPEGSFEVLAAPFRL